MNTCLCGSNTQRVDFEIHVCAETKKYKSSQCLGNCLLPYNPCSLTEFDCLASHFPRSMQIAEQSLFFAVSVAG